MAEKPSLRADQVQQTRAALVAAGRRLFGSRGFAASSVDDLAAEARVSSGALYHHFPNKTALFETVFEAIHTEVLDASFQAAAATPDLIEQLALGFDAFLDAALEPDVQRIILTDAPAVLGLARFQELDEKYAFAAIVAALEAAKKRRLIAVREPETLARLLLGALTRGGMLIAEADDQRATRDAVAATMRDLLRGLAR
jgi:AcrR family transcriptional regulator